MYRNESSVSKGVIWALLIGNVLQIFVILVRLRVSPAEVLGEVQAAELRLRTETESIVSQQGTMIQILDGRREWMSDLTASLRSLDESIEWPPVPE